MKINLIKVFFRICFLGTLIFSQGDFNLEDLNPNSESYGELIGPDDYYDDIVIVYFGHEY